MKRIMMLALLMWGAVCGAQNLVPNANFANYSTCPSALGELSALGWKSPFFPGTPDYFNVCGGPGFEVPQNIAGQQEALTGAAYIGVYTYGLGANREYIQAVLSEPTVAGMTYELTLIYSAADNFGHADGLGLLLSAGEPETPVGQSPQLKKTIVLDSQDEWQTLTGEYLSATGGETHITIGNFSNNASTDFTPEGMYTNNAYYYIDSVAVKCLGAPSGNIAVDLGGDLKVCATDFPLTIFSNLPAACNEWSTGETGNWIEVNEPGSYAVKSTLSCEYGTDTIKISLATAPEELIGEETICAAAAFTIRLDPEAGAYEWNDGSLEPQLAVEESGLYSVILTHECGTVTDSVAVVIGNKLINPAWPRLHVLCNDDPLTVDLNETTAALILWDDGDTAATRTILDEGDRFVRLSDACSDTVFHFRVDREICSSETIYIPNAFSPNADGINDYLSIGFSENWASPKIKFHVFDRWGAPVFYTENPYFRWNGTVRQRRLDPGMFVYFYELEIEIGGQTRTMTDSGEITLLR